ncbi:MAG TPA: AEC family transporter [Acidocella sp.]|jgi:malonate transporter|uniref:AEC family transporter n=1 Tax=Acidocella sp. TaxID=50710 RepID=UPI002B70A2E9|nr:AEC family transporter [Acidocella sp.]HVE22708.1 AEC family transporter [Acidocella sp.]
MSAVFNAVLPIFALILTGFICARRGILGPGATDSLNKFVVWLALPALLFQAMAGITWAGLDHPGFLAAFAGGMMITFALSFLLAPFSTRPAHHRLADRSIEGLNAAYANTGFMGIPLCVVALGHTALVPAVIATILTACVLFAGAIVLIETDLNEQPRLGATLRKVGLSLLRNPLVAAPLLGLAVALFQGVTHVPMPALVFRFTTLLGAAASPCALVTIGLFLAQSESAQETGVVTRLVALKLLIQPAITGLLAFFVFGMPALWADTALLMSALPIGTGPFMLAKLYDREAAVTSRAILVSTVLSLVTVSALVAWLH